MCLCGHVQIDGACNCVCFAGRCADAAVDCVVVYASWLASSADDRFSFWAEVVVNARTCMVVECKKSPSDGFETAGFLHFSCVVIQD